MNEKNLAPLQGRPHATAASLTAEAACLAGRTLNSLHDILHVKSGLWMTRCEVPQDCSSCHRRPIGLLMQHTQHVVGWH